MQPCSVSWVEDPLRFLPGSSHSGHALASLLAHFLPTHRETRLDLTASSLAELFPDDVHFLISRRQMLLLCEHTCVTPPHWTCCPLLRGQLHRPGGPPGLHTHV